MASASHSFSKRHGTILLVALLALAGCASQSTLLGDGFRLSILDDGNDTRIVAANAPADIKKSSAKNAVKAVIIPVNGAPAAKSSWCTYLQEDTAAQTTIMRAPTLSGSLADDGKANVSMGMSLTNFAKANVMEETAEARCRRQAAEAGLQKLVFISPQGLTSAGYRAKSKAILAQKKAIQSQRRKISQAMADGFLDREKATMLMGFADQLLSEAAHAKSQADRRTGDFLGAKDKASVLGRELMRAEADLEDLNSRMRTFDSVDVSVSAGWKDDVSNRDFGVDQQDFGGQVSFSVKLGAMSPERFAHEERAKEAKLRAIGEEGGTLWQVRVLRLAHERAIQGLVESQADIQKSIDETGRLLANLRAVSNPEFQAAEIGAQFRLYQLQSDKAAVQGSIAEIRTNLQRLKTEG